MTAKKQKSDKLVCRYCGSDDLAPSFVKRRDRRCRKCFAKRYGSAARTLKAAANTPAKRARKKSRSKPRVAEAAAIPPKAVASQS